ncbi:MAG: bifunctional 2-C-methyl-D-erythritol 4-phosphate cytidylyltransferase/2-C-methyl-D-erythritol 2,4-cyclodiphosphate synthase [Neomegalonema sp.]|nr:bifunctional 2-C-methyl-D-erythritol 4-phosphate cytidylyltransferase/2-C-methyl-D-erythritol 2,4-cyclodiphosphate synthase [Neomegalonema sp.]
MVEDGMSCVALVLAAGRGSRAGAGLPKQYRPVAGRSALLRSLLAFASVPAVDRLQVSIHPDDQSLYVAEIERLPEAIRSRLNDPVFGGGERQDSVRLALEALAATAPKLVLIHDGARPFVSTGVIQRVLAALESAQGACAAAPLVDTLRRETTDGACGDLLPRDGLWRAQTPQGFHFEPILAAHRHFAGAALTDDAEIARRAGITTKLTLGAPENIKLTRPEDFDFAEHWAAQEKENMTEVPSLIPDIRVGQGFDVHAFGPNADGSTDHLMLCGVRVPHDQGVQAHSDGDVGLHALTDAILGAGALGDIGRHFPPSDPQWRAASSDQFLAHALALAASHGARLMNVDITLICERPKITPYAEAMRGRVAEILALPMERVSIKATTTEKLGFTGRREGIAALATATLLFS